MRIVLFGGTDLTVAVATLIEQLGQTVAGVVTLERTFKISYANSPVTNVRFADLASWCASRDVPCHSWDGAHGAVDMITPLGPDFGLAVGWYHFLPTAVRRLFPRGCAGIHASLLPKLRGGAPLNWAILSGEKRTGVSMFELGDGVDDGLLFGQRSFAIEGAEIGAVLTYAQEAALALLTETLPAVERGTTTLVPQEGSPSYCLQRRPEDGLVDWHQPAELVERHVRAVGRPYPGAFSFFRGRKVLIWRAHSPADGPVVLGAPGQLWRPPGAAGMGVVTGSGMIVVDEASWADGSDAVTELRRAGNDRLSDANGE